MQSNTTCGLGVSYTLRGEENDVSMDGRHAGRETKCLQKHERCTMWKSTVEPPTVQTINQNIRAGCLVWYYNLRIIPGTSHKLRSFWVGPRRVLRLIAPALGEIKPVYYPGEEKLVSLNMLKLYRGEDVIRQDPEDIDPDRWLDKSKLTELPEAPLGEAEMRSQELFLDQRSPEIPPEPDL